MRQLLDKMGGDLRLREIVAVALVQQIERRSRHCTASASAGSGEAGLRLSARMQGGDAQPGGERSAPRVAGELGRLGIGRGEQLDAQRLLHLSDQSRLRQQPRQVGRGGKLDALAGGERARRAAQAGAREVEVDDYEDVWSARLINVRARLSAEWR